MNTPTKAITAIIGIIATTLSSTNPNMPDCEHFIQRCALEKAKQISGADLLYHLVGDVSAKFFIRHTERRDYLFISTYGTELNTYVGGTYRIGAVGMLNNFYARLEHDGERQEWKCY